MQEKLPRKLVLSGPFAAVASCVLMVVMSPTALAVPYAAGVSESGSTVTYFLNEDADSITVKMTGEADLVLAGADLLKGSHTFNKGGATAYDIEVSKSTAAGYTETQDPNNINTNFFRPVGVAVNRNSDSPYFGHIYVSESATGVTTSGRDMLDGIYALGPDQSDVFGLGDDGNIGGMDTSTSVWSSPFKISVAPDDSVYIADWADGHAGVWRAPADLGGAGDPATFPNVLANDNCDGIGYCDNHGSIPSVYVEGTGASTTLYTMDEDWTAADPNAGGGSRTGRGDIHRYDIGTSTNFTDQPIKVVNDGGDPNGSPAGKIQNGRMDFVRDDDGSWWISQFRSDDSYDIPSLSHWADDPNDGKPLWNSGKENREPGDSDWDTDIDGADFLTWQRNAGAEGTGTVWQGDANGDTNVDSDDLAIWEEGYGKDKQQGVLVLQAAFGDLDIHNDLDLLVIGTRWSNGVYIIDISDPNAPVLLDTIPQVGDVRDVAFDAAGNVYVVNNSSEKLEVWSPGGSYIATTSSDGSFTLAEPSLFAAVPEPATLFSSIMFSLFALFGYRPCRQPVSVR